MSSNQGFGRFLHLLRELVQTPGAVDWRVRWRQATECLWKELESGARVRSDIFEQYLELVQDDDRFGHWHCQHGLSGVLKGKPSSQAPQSQQQRILEAQQQRILEVCRDRAGQAQRLNSMQQADFDADECREEKRILMAGIFGSQSRERCKSGWVVRLRFFKACSNKCLLDVVSV
ncbi:hypothetical protein AC579_10112 [Pseudocercospora musae]|uniref:Uncharacterized protein n=1 Tax=Pseudocercospora musae TaxID=113226 RepID=A0A139GT88_9PEZI|nr:hypothetical protein AC579_10112 [Pseudocercospora musae]